MPLFNSNWRLTLLVYALVAFLITFIWIIISRESTFDQSDTESKNLLKNMKTFPELLSIAQVRMILLIVLGMFLFNHGTNNWIPEIFIDLGNTQATAGFLSAIPVVTGALGSIVLPQYIKKQINLNEAQELITIKTRQYAKRQATWARSRMGSWKKISPIKFNDYIKKLNKSSLKLDQLI